MHTALVLFPVRNSRHVPVKLQLQLRLSLVAPLRGSDPYPNFPNSQRANFQQLCLQLKLLQPYLTRHSAPSCSQGVLWGWGVSGASQGPPVFLGLRVSLAATFWAGSGQGQGSAQPG